jgi:uncharacterized protein YjbI with pentapeptide repeats
MGDDATVAQIPPRSSLWPNIWAGVQTAAKVFETLGKFAIVVTVVLWIKERPQRDQAAIYQAWQVINLAAGQHGSGGRVEALQDLNRKRVDLMSLSAPNSNLTKMRLPHAYLSFADLRRSLLGGADLHESELYATDFRGAYVGGVDFRDGLLEKANFSGNTTHISDTKFDGADLKSADFSFALVQNSTFATTDEPISPQPWPSQYKGPPHRTTNLVDADFTGSPVIHVKFASASLRGSMWYRSEVRFSSFGTVDARNSIFRCSHVDSTDYSGSLEAADFSEAYLHSVHFRGADLRNAKFTGASLVGVDFRGAKHFSVAQLRQARFVAFVWLDKNTLIRERGVFSLSPNCEMPRYRTLLLPRPAIR